MSKSALKRLRRKQAQENAATSTGADGEEQEEDDDEGELQQEEGDGDEVVSTAAPTVSTTAVLPQIVPASAPLHTAADSAATTTVASTPPITTEAPAGVPPKLGVIGKSSRLNASDVDSFRATELPRDQLSPPQPSTASASAPPQLHQQQQLINLLLGDNSAATNLGMGAPSHTYTPAPVPVPVPAYTPQQHQHYQAPPQYQQYQQPVYQQQYQYTAPPSNFRAYQYDGQYAPSSALYGPAGGTASQSSHSNVIQPPGKSAQSRATPGAPGMSIQTQQEPPSAFAPPLLTPPPPGLTPPGGTSSSRFTFAEYTNTAPIPQLTTTETYYPSAASNSLNHQPAAVLYDNNTGNKQASSGNYYKSKSGFSVRL